MKDHLLVNVIEHHPTSFQVATTLHDLHFLAAQFYKLQVSFTEVVCTHLNMKTVKIYSEYMKFNYYYIP